MRWLRVAAYAVIVVMFSAGLWLTEHRFDQALERQCELGNEGRGDLRRAISEVLVDNLVEAARQAPDPVVIDERRANLLDDLEREFGDRPCR